VPSKRSRSSPRRKPSAWATTTAKAATGVTHQIRRQPWRFKTLITNSPKRLEDAGVPPAQVEQSLRDITDQVKDKGPGGHILTGPIYIEGAEIGDVLEVRILATKLADSLCLSTPSGRAAAFCLTIILTRKPKIIPLDAQRMVAKFAPGIEISAASFFRQYGRRAAGKRGPLHSAPPWIMGGNLDNKDLVAGSTLYLPVHAPRRAL